MNWLQDLLLGRSRWVSLRALVLELYSTTAPRRGLIARAVVDFDAARCSDPLALTSLGCRVHNALKAPRTTEERVVARLAENQIDPDHPRRYLLPEGLAESPQAFLIDLPIPRSRLPRGLDPLTLIFRAVPCLGDPNVRSGPGRVEVQRVTRGDLDLQVRLRLEALQSRGVPLLAALVQANHELFAPGPHDRPCAVLFSFDPYPRRHPEYLLELASQVYALKSLPPTDHCSTEVARLVRNETTDYYRRFRLPSEFTDGIPVYYGDLWIYRFLLPHQYLTPNLRLLPCVATAGDRGEIELLPVDEPTARPESP